MRIERTKNASRNILFGSILKLYQTVIPFAMRTIMVYTIGMQYLGLNSLFTSILQVLNLAELGVGSAMVFSMYKPIAEDDSSTICALMKLYRLYYRIIGGVILLAGIALLPFIPNLISGDVPEDINIYWLYILNLSATVLTYWLFAYRNSILNAYQRTDVVSIVRIVTDTLRYGFQIVALVYLKSYYAYVIVILLTQIVNNIVTAIASKKLFPDYFPIGNLPREDVKKINAKIRDLFTSKIGYTIVGSADTIVISAFIGLTALALYQNYYYIMSAVIGFVTIIYNSVTAGVGNSMLTKDKKEVYKDFNVFTLLVTFICGVCISCFASLYQPFMKLWMGADMLLDNKMVVLFCLYFWVYELVMMISVYKDAGGIWHEDRFRPLISGVVNLILNLLLVRVIGLYGILSSTILSMCCVSLPWIISNVFRMVFKRNAKEYVLLLLKYSGCIGLATGCTYFLTGFVTGNGWISLFGKGILTLLCSSIILALLLSKEANFTNAANLLLRLLKMDKILKAKSRR